MHWGRCMSNAGRWRGGCGRRCGVAGGVGDAVNRFQVPCLRWPASRSPNGQRHVFDLVTARHAGSLADQICLFFPFVIHEMDVDLRCDLREGAEVRRSYARTPPNPFDVVDLLVSLRMRDSVVSPLLSFPQTASSPVLRHRDRGRSHRALSWWTTTPHHLGILAGLRKLNPVVPRQQKTAISSRAVGPAVEARRDRYPGTLGIERGPC
jgi:hypothetical protein